MSTLEKAGIGLGVAVGVVVSALLNGWVLSSYWAWFFVPAGLPAFGFWHLVGMAAMVSMMSMAHTTHLKNNFKNNIDRAAHFVTIVTVRPTVFWLSGWVYHSFMP